MSDSSSEILLVDDFEDAREIYREYLSYRGYRVSTASDAVEALDHVQARCPDLILLDLRMPGMSGLEAMPRLRALCPAGTIIVALTAHALAGERAAVLASGFDGFIPKPCLPDELARHIEDFLARGRDAV